MIYKITLKTRKKHSMNELEHHEIKQKLRHYVNDRLRSMNTGARQKEAVQKMLFLSKEQFEELAKDIAHEIERRNNGLDYFNIAQEVTESRKSMCKLSHDNFCNLIIDVLLAMNTRFFPAEHEENTRDLLNELEVTFEKLKVGKFESIIEEIKAEPDFKDQLNLYNEHLFKIFEKHGVDPLIIREMMEISNKYFDPTYQKEFSSLFNVADFLKYSENFFKNEKNYEYNHYKRNISSLQRKKPKGYKKFIKREMINIFQLIMFKHDISDRKNYKLILQTENLNLISNLENFVIVTKATSDEATIKQATLQLLEASHLMYNKLLMLNSDIDERLIVKYKEQQDKISDAVDKGYGGFAILNDVLEFSYFVIELSSILKIN